MAPVLRGRPAVEDRSRQFIGRASADRRRRRLPQQAGADEADGRGGEAGTPSPDGKWDVAAVNKPRDEAKVTYASEFERRHQERFKGAIFDWKDFQRDGAEFPVANPVAQPAQQIVVRPRPLSSASDAAKILLDMDLRPTNFAWHPDGQTIAFTADPEWRNELRYNSPDLWTVTTDGKVTRLTNDGYVYGDVGYSPDGKYLSYSRSFGTDMIIEKRLNHGGPQDLYLRPTAGGEPINLTASWDLDPGPARWSPDSRFIYFTAGIGGETHLFRVSVPGDRPLSVEQVTKGPRRIAGLSYDKSFTKILYTVGLHEAPADLYVANIDGSNEHRLTNIHSALVSEIAFSKTVRLRWPSHDGTQIEGWLTFPYGYDPSKGSVPDDRHEPRRPACCYGIHLRFQGSVLRRQWLFRLRHEFPQLDRLRRCFQVGHLGRLGTEGRRGRRLRH